MKDKKKEEEVIKLKHKIVEIKSNRIKRRGGSNSTNSVNSFTPPHNKTNYTPIYFPTN